MSACPFDARILLFAETDLGEVFEAALHDAGLQCVCVRDVSLALALHAAGTYDAAIIDMDGGDRGALALIREMRARSPSANIVACIWRNDGSDAERSAGASATLEKPFGLSELLEALEPIGREREGPPRAESLRDRSPRAAKDPDRSA